MFGPYWGNNWSCSFFCQFMELTCHLVHKHAKKKRAEPIFSQDEPHASSVTSMSWERISMRGTHGLDPLMVAGTRDSNFFLPNFDCWILDKAKQLRLAVTKLPSFES